MRRRGYIRTFLSRAMIGRNGADTLYNVCLIVSLVLAFTNLFFGSVWLYLVYMLLLVYAMFRCFSRNVAKRRRENEAFCRFFRNFRQNMSYAWSRLTDRKHVYRTCAHCSCRLRLPRVKGEHTVRCPKCGRSFDLKI